MSKDNKNVNTNLYENLDIILHKGIFEMKKKLD